MKNLLILCLVVFGLTSCSKDSLDQDVDQLIQPSKSELFVNVSYISWENNGQNGCSSSGGEVVKLIRNATIELYLGDQSTSDTPGTPVVTARTGTSGYALIENIDPALYTVVVSTSLGQKSRTITTILHKRSHIDFSF